MVYELPPMRPPSEAYSLLLRVHRGCPWNKCTFCSAYKNIKFDKSCLRSVEELKQDILTARKLADTVKQACWLTGSPGRVTEGVVAYIVRRYGIDISCFPWLIRDAGEPRSAFLGDSNAIIIRTEELCEIVRFLRSTFPSIERVTSYGRAKTVVRKTVEELKALREAGLDRLHLGLESGDDEVLSHVRKGATAEEMIRAGKMVKEAGIELSEYVMPGLGGEERSVPHALNTARVLNEIDPDFIRFRPFVPREGTPLYEEYIHGEFKLLSPHGYLREIKLMVENLKVTGRICFDHRLNPCYKDGGRLIYLLSLDYEGYKLPEAKEEVLELLERGLSIPEEKFIRMEQWMLVPQL